MEEPSIYLAARSAYAEIGVDSDAAISRALEVPLSVHCWQADDVAGFEVHDGPVDTGGILATGSYPGRARNADEVRQDYEEVFSLVPGVCRANLHAIYAETGGRIVSRDELTVSEFRGWIDWAKARGIGLDFNPTYFAHPKAADGWTLSSADRGIQGFWVRHGQASRRIASGIADALGKECVNNHWIPDGAKDSPADRWSPRARLAEALDEVLAEPLAGCADAVESKLFGIGSEDYVVGSFEFYSHYALTHGKLLCLDMGHFHPTETIADKLSALLQFHPRLLLHLSRPMRWDSDHVVLFNDDLRAVFQELVRGDALDRVSVALDYFDASINRIGAYMLGIRAARKAILYALLEPTDELKRLELEGRLAEKLALMEELKTYPFGAIWDEMCRRDDVPVGRESIADVTRYGRAVLSKRI
jgi:L-rhamnose isomerase